LRGPIPPNGYRYVDPESGFIAEGYDLGDWVAQEEKHLRANAREVPADLQAKMEEQLCQTLPPGWCMYDDPSRPRASSGLEWGDVQGGIATFLKWLKGGCRFVEQAEADRRALVCSRCYLNVAVAGCTACKAAVVEVLGSRVTRHDHALRACGVCKCLLRAKVHFPIETLDTETEKLQGMYPEHCWLKKGGFNFYAP
jgi:hypothetical protein